jgi:eukaryotic-like serine/threonine-protein kinase
VRRFWTVVLAAVGGIIATVPNLVRSGSPASPWLVIGAVAVSAAFGGIIDHVRRRDESEEHRRNQLKQAVIDGCITFDGRRLPLVRNVTDPTLLGVHRAASITAHATGNARSNNIPSYVERDVDEEFRRLIAAGGFVLLVGDSTAGKSRAAYEAIQAMRSSDVLLVPRSRGDIAAAVAHARGVKRCVLWLDDLERYIGAAEGLHANQVAGLLGIGPGVLICATLRAEERRRLEDVGRSGDESNRSNVREARQVLRLATTVHIERRFSSTEMHQASVTAKDDLQIGAALTHAGDYGLAEYLAAGPQLLSRWHDGWAPGQRPRGAALVMAAVDCRRTGLVRPATRELLIRLHEHYLADHGGSRLRPEPLEAAFAWATETQQATTALLYGNDSDGYVVFDYLVDSVQRGATPEDRVPEEALRMMLDYIDCTDAFAITNLAVDYGWYDLASAAAETAWNLAESLPPHHPDALTAGHGRARVTMWQGRYQLARDRYRTVLAGRTKALGARHPDTLATRHDHAWTLSACGEHEAAETEFMAVLALRTEVFGAQHRLTLSAQHNLAWVVFQGGEPLRARTIYEAVLAAREEALNADQHSIVTTRHDLARIAAALGDHERAGDEYAAVLRAWLPTLGEHHPYVLTVRHNIAVLALAEGDLEKADEQFRAVLADRSRVLGFGHPHTLATRHELGRVAAARGRAAEAAAIYAAVIEDRSSVLGPDHPHTIVAVDELAALRTS